MEDVPRFIWDHPERFTIFNLEAPPGMHMPHLRVTLDYPEDLVLIQTIYENIYPRNPQFRTPDVLTFIRQHPELLKINSHCKQMSAAYIDN